MDPDSQDSATPNSNGVVDPSPLTTSDVDPNKSADGKSDDADSQLPQSSDSGIADTEEEPRLLPSNAVSWEESVSAVPYESSGIYCEPCIAAIWNPAGVTSACNDDCAIHSVNAVCASPGKCQFSGFRAKHNNTSQMQSSVINSSTEIPMLLQNLGESLLKTLDMGHEWTGNTEDSSVLQRLESASTFLVPSDVLKMPGTEESVSMLSWVNDESYSKAAKYNCLQDSCDTYSGQLHAPDLLHAPQCECEQLGDFDRLPTEIIQKVFSYFSQYDLCHTVALVCHKWTRFAYDPIFWRSIDVSSKESMKASELVHVCLQRAPLLKELVVKGHVELTADDMKAIAKACPMIQHLDLGFNQSVNYDLIYCMSRNCEELTELNLEGCSAVDNHCVLLLCRLRKLRSLNLSHCIRLYDHSVIALAHSLPCLTSLNIDGISWISDRAVEELVNCRKGTLRFLDLDGAELTSCSVQAIASCQLLERLSISFAELLSDDALTYLMDTRELKELRLKKGLDLSANAFESLFKTPALRNLSLLEMNDCNLIQDDTVEAICKCCGPRLKTLKLCWCWHITDVGLQWIIDSCPKLEILDVMGMDKITGKCLEEIPEKLPKLTLLDLSQCDRIIDDLIIEVIHRKPDLTVFNYYGEEFIHFSRMVQNMKRGIGTKLK